MPSHPDDERQSGDSLRRLTTICAFLVLASAGAASLLEAKVRDGTLPRLVTLLRDEGEPLAIPARKGEPLRVGLRQTTLDYQPTGSIPVSLATPVVLDPCTGARK